MNILFFSDHFLPEPSAPAAHVFERARLWAAAGHSVTVITSAPNFPDGIVHAGYRNAWRTLEMMDGIRVVRVKTLIAKNEGFALRIADYASYALSSFFFSLWEKRPDVVISSSPHLFVPFAGVAYSLVKRVPHVFELRDLWPASIAATTSMKSRRLLRLLEKLELWLYRRSRRVLAFTRSFRDDLASRGIAPEKIDVVINGANLELFKPIEQKHQATIDEYGLRDRFVIGYLGTLGLAHGLMNVVEAAERLRDTPVTFFFVGVGAAKEELQKEVARRGLDNVVFAPRQERQAMPRFWSACDVSLIHLKDDPVFSTVIPSKIFESMAVGLPMIYSGPEGDGTHIVREERAGLVVPAGNPDALAAAAKQLCSDVGLRQTFAQSSRVAAGNYSRARQADACIAVMKRAVEDPAAGRKHEVVSASASELSSDGQRPRDADVGGGSRS
jgi:colanic acid biosynthesis glycosyl transferase WcaI